MLVYAHRISARVLSVNLKYPTKFKSLHVWSCIFDSHFETLGLLYDFSLETVTKLVTRQEKIALPSQVLHLYVTKVCPGDSILLNSKGYFLLS